MKIFRTCLAIMVILLTSTINVKAGNHAFSVGTDEGSTSINTSDSATYAASCFGTAGYTSNYSIQPTVSTLRGYFADGDKRLQSKVLFFAGHANYNNINWDYQKSGVNKCGVWTYTDNDSISTGYQYAGLLSNNLSNTKVAMFFGCKTGDYSNGQTTLVDVAHNQGAQCAIGWTNTVSTTDATKWRKAFVLKLAQGCNVNEARSYANGLSYTNTSVKNTYTQGSIYTIITGPVNSFSEGGNDYEGGDIIAEPLTEEDIRLYERQLEGEHYNRIITDGISVDINDPNIDLIVDVVNNLVTQEYSAKDFDVETTSFIEEKGSGVITLTYCIKDIKTTTNISLIVSGGKIVEITSNGVLKKISNFESIPEHVIPSETMISKYDEQEMVSNSTKIVSRQITKWFDIETNKSYVVVETEYYDDSTDSYWDVIHQY